MTVSLHPQPAPVGGAPDEHKSTPPPQVRGPPQAVGATAAAKPSTTIPPTSPGAPNAPPNAPSSAAATEFPLFGQLPAEIRLQVWRTALPPRTVELHSSRYSSHYARSAPGPWHSSSGNPPPLAACAEARQEGLRRYYTVALPVISPAGLPPPDDGGADDEPSPHHVPRPAAAANPERRLYLDPLRDTVVILGALEYRRLEALRAYIARQDAQGLRRLALTTGGFMRGSAGPELRVWARVGLLAGLDQFTLLLHDEPWPPEAVGRGGHVGVVACSLDDRRYTTFATSHRQHLGSGSGWIVIGARNRRMEVARLEFVRADGVRVG